MLKETLHQVVLRRARDLAGGVSYLSLRLGVSAHDLDAMMPGKDIVPMWLFLRAVDFINEAESQKTLPPGFPENWQDLGDLRQ